RLSILLDRNPDEGRRVAKETFDEAPAEPACVVAQALSLHSQGRTAEGIVVLQKLPVDKLHDPRVALYLAVLLLNDSKPDAAREFIDAANSGFVFPEEKKLLQEALQKQQSVAVPSPPSALTPTPAPTTAASPANPSPH
ncbi:MAG TPA: hypothetical protein VIH43_04450, partial [Chthoniobacterales bacterium]